MRRYLAGRLLQAVFVVFLVTTITFVVVHLAPGDPIALALDRPGTNAAVRQHWREELGLDRPLGVQYARWLRNAARGELGYSFTYRRPVRDVIVDAMPRTILLVGLSIVLSFALGILIGTLQAEEPGSRSDRWWGRILLVLYSVPDFWLGLIALLIFAYRIPIFPPSGIVDPVMYDYLSAGGKLADRLKHLALPVTVLTLLSTALISRHQRSALVEILPTDWMRTARAKGLSRRAALRTHGLRNALLPVITMAGLNLSVVVAGSVFTEKVFSWPGMGLLMANAIGARDYSLITAGVLITSVVVALGALFADVATAVSDPRIRLG